MRFLDNVFKKKSTIDASTRKVAPSEKDNTAFLEAMGAVGREDSPATRNALYEAMLKAWFFVPTPASEAPSRPGQIISDGNTRLQFPIIQDKTGKRILPTFTDEEALAYWAGGGSHWTALLGMPLFQSVVKTEVDEIAVNPPSPGRPIIRPGGRITRNEFTVLSDGMIPETNLNDNSLQMRVAAPQKVLIGMPSKMPRQELLDCLSEAAASHSAVRALYFCSLAFDKSVPHNAVAVELAAQASQPEVEKAVAAFGSAIHPWLSKNEFLDFYPTRSSPLLEAIKKKGRQIYVTRVP